MNTATLWQQDHTDGSLSQHTIDPPLWMNRDGSPVDTACDDVVTLAAVVPHGDVVAVALIPESLDRVVRHNRVPTTPGMLTLQHADRLDIADRKFWIAVAAEAELTEYSASRHAADVFCFLTKARLREGEPIAICAGKPGTNCGTIYKLSAWEAMLTQSDFRCANCGFDPTDTAWRPPQTRPLKRLDAILAALAKGTRS